MCEQLQDLRDTEYASLNNLCIGYKKDFIGVTNHFDVTRESKHAIDNEKLLGAHNGVESSSAAFGHAQTTQTTAIPQWQRELANSRVGRHSRASSIISTRTRLTHQSDDARSIEFEAGGQSFRISRDGSRIANLTAPPPYPGPPLEQLAEESDEEEPSVLTRHSVNSVRERSPDSQLQAESVEAVLPVRAHLLPEALQHERLQTLDRRLSVLELPQRLKSALRWYGSDTLTTENTNAPVASTTGVLRRTRSDSSSLRNVRPSHLDLAGEWNELSMTPNLDAERQIHGSRSVIDRCDEQANEMRHNYARMMRDMDHEHRKRLHERDNLSARMRELLDEKDKVYRQQLRERDFAIESLKEEARFKDGTINELKTRIYEMGEDVQISLEKARNEVEEIWMKRWKEYEALLKESLSQKHTQRGLEVDLPRQDSAMAILSPGHGV
ncbi:hypothetical protein LTR70_000099 [Exophiala xenobiotica]|uniref:Uncharacterized protein n=1 Tax=Lithohypha guttulata TaxID=1690604 RepID=A0ABR0KP34_9EURO|nr:hypothetical protein LTR24_000224 [Lithohypha guttulata]KAK5330777.1 hypothetical protein LTR70_000099 [Exophiala xenobiotica]